jgi:hypothetical protein
MVVNNELAGLLKDMGDVEHFPHLCVNRGILGIGRRADSIQLGRRPVSFVANKVTSTPRATSASVKRLVTCSQGP